MKANKWLKIGQVAAVAAGIGLLAGKVWADNQVDGLIINAGGGPLTNSCVGVYYATAKMTNSSGSTWIVPPTNVTSGTLTDISGYPSPYSSVVFVEGNNMSTSCGTNSVTFSVTSNAKYNLDVYVKSTPPPTNGTPITMQINWQ